MLREFTEKLNGLQPMADRFNAFLRAIPAMSADRQAIMAEAWLKERKPAFAGLEDACLQFEIALGELVLFVF